MEQILRKISKFPEILGELSMRKQCVPGAFSSTHALEPGNEAGSLYAVQWLSTSTASDLCTLLLTAMCVRTVCVDAEQKNAKLNNRTWLNGLLTIGEHQNFLEEGKFIAGGASVVSIVSHCCPNFMVFGIV